MARERGVAAGRFALELDGAFAGWLTSASGGEAEGEVVQEPLGADSVVRKHLGGVHYTDLELTAGAGMEKAFSDWIAATLAHTGTRKDGTVISVDATLKEVARRTFFNALVREIELPVLDAGAKDAATLMVRVAPEDARTTKGSGAKVAAPSSAKVQKKWLPSIFRLQIDGVDCKNVRRIEALTIKQNVVDSSIGERRDFLQEESQLELGDLIVTVPESKAADFVAWHDDFVIKGNNGSSAEKSGKLELLAPDLKSVLLTLDFGGLGIFKLERRDGGAEGALPTLRAAIYCEELTFTAA